MQLSKHVAFGAIAFLAALLAAGTFVDLSLSMAVYQPQSLYGRFFEAFGELPGVLVAAFGFAALLVTRCKKTKLSAVGALAGYGAPLVLFSVMAVAMPIHYLGNGKGFFLVPVLGILVAAGLVFAAGRIPQAQRTALRQAAVVGILTFLCALIVVNILKNIWGRPRFRSMDDPALQFLAWYLPQGSAAGEEFRSFPSGHSANSSVIVWITLLPTFLPALKDKKAALFTAAAAWSLLTMFSRIVMGAHFLSDVATGTLITLLSFLLLTQLFYSKQKQPLPAR